MISLGKDGWKTSQASDLFGHIIRTKNIDFDRRGYVGLSRKPLALYSTDSDADFDRLIAIVADANLYYFVTTDHVFTLAPSVNALTFDELTGTNQPSVQVGSDAVYFAGAPVVSGSTTVTDWTGSAWTSAARITGLSSSYPHPLCVFENRNELAVANGNVVTTYNTSYSLQNTLTLPSKFVVTTMRWRGNLLFIGTRDLSGGNAMVFLWSGTGTSAQQGYDAGANWVYSMCEYGSSVAILTSAAQLKRFNGGGFEVLDNLPIYYTPAPWLEFTGAAGTGKCLNRGMIAIGDVIYLNIDGEAESNNGAPNYNVPSGLWVYDPQIGLYHTAGYVSEKFKTISISSLSSSEFVMASAHGVETGDPVWASSVTNIAALTVGQIYYAIKTSSTAFKLAVSPADAFAGRHLTCSGTISGDTLAFDDPAQVGATYQIRPGPVFGFTNNQPNLFFASEVFFGGSSQDLDGNTISALMSLGMGRNVGSFVTPKLPASAVKDTFQKLIAKLKELRLDTDKIIIKYRTTERHGLPTPQRYVAAGRATWTDDSNFTIDTTKKDVRSAQVGDEVEIVEGAGAGYTGHITAIDDSTSTYTFTIDEDIPVLVSGDLSEINIDNWTKLGVITKDTNTISENFLEQILGTSATWCQLKVELRGRDIAINTLDVVNEKHKLAV